MDPLQKFEARAAAARADRPPTIDVADRVLATLAERPVPRASAAKSFAGWRAAVGRSAAWRPARAWSAATSDDRALWIGSAVSIVAASIALLVALDAWGSMTDPMLGWFDSLTLVML